MRPTLATIPGKGDRTIRIPLWFALEIATHLLHDPKGWPFANIKIQSEGWGSDEERAELYKMLEGTRLNLGSMKTALMDCV